MKIYNHTNIVNAVLSDKYLSIPPKNTPLYLYRYTMDITMGQPAASVLWSTISFLPAEIGKRVLNITAELFFKDGLPDGSTSTGVATILIDLSNVILFAGSLIGLEGPLEGIITRNGNNISYDAQNFVEYQYYEATSKLSLTLVSVMQTTLPSSSPAKIFMNIYIKDDVFTGGSQPPLYPNVIGHLCYKLPTVFPNRGSYIVDSETVRIKILLVMVLCFEWELQIIQRTQLSSVGDKFTPQQTIIHQLETEGIAIPSRGIQFTLYAAEDYPDVRNKPQPPETPSSWIVSNSMTHTCREMQMLLTFVPEVDISIVYRYRPFTSIDSQVWPVITWMSNIANDNLWDIAVISQTEQPLNPYLVDSFNSLLLQYNEQFNVMTAPGRNKNVVIAAGNTKIGDNSFYRTYPVKNVSTGIEGVNPYFQFMYAYNPFFGSGGSQLSKNSDGAYDSDLPFTATEFTAGGYLSQTIRPYFQGDVVYGSPYETSDTDPEIKRLGKPDISGHAVSIIFTMPNDDQDEQFNSVYFSGTSYTPQPLGALFAMIMCNLERKDFDFMHVLYLKAESFCTPITKGNNQQYDCKDFADPPLWSPVCGLGSLNYSLFFNAFNVLQEGDVIQISVRNMFPRMSFFNLMPENPFHEDDTDAFVRQPVLGPSSIFSHFVLKKVVPTSPNDVHTNEAFYLYDITETRVLTIIEDPSELGFYVCMTHLTETDNQKWIVSNVKDIAETSVVFSYDSIIIRSCTDTSRILSGSFDRDVYYCNSPSVVVVVGDMQTYLSTHPEVFFTMCLDSSVTTSVINQIKYHLNNDNYSYYINFCNDFDGNINYITNPYRTNIEDFDVRQQKRKLIYDNPSVENPKIPIWDQFKNSDVYEPYPEWILIPAGDGGIDPILRNKREYMIFNTTLQAYMYIVCDSTTDSKLRMVPLSYGMVQQENIFYYQFIFTIVTNNIKPYTDEIFVAHTPVKTGLPYYVDSEFMKTEQYIDLYNVQMPTPPYDGKNIRVYRIKSGPFYFISDPVEIEELPYSGGVLVYRTKLFWVCRKYILTNAKTIQLIAFNNSTDEQINNGWFINGDGIWGGQKAPKMVQQVNLQYNEWSIEGDKDINGYIYFLENIFTGTEDVKNTVVRFYNSIDDGKFMGRLPDMTPGENPFMITSTDDNRDWFVSTQNVFGTFNVESVGTRGNYLYGNTVYSFKSFNENVGILSSSDNVYARYKVPSTYTDIQSSLWYGSPNTEFTIGLFPS